MPYRITKEHVWAGAIPDHPDALAAKLRALAEGGVNLELVIARREWSGQGLLFISPLRTLEEIELAEKAGLAKEDSILAVRVEGPNIPGLAAKISTALSKAGLNLRAYSAAALGEVCVTSIAVDMGEDADRAKAVLEQALAQ